MARREGIGAEDRDWFIRGAGSSVELSRFRGASAPCVEARPSAAGAGAALWCEVRALAPERWPATARSAAIRRARRRSPRGLSFRHPAAGRGCRRPPSACSRQRSSGAAAPGVASRASGSPPSNGWTGSTTTAPSSRPARSHPPRRRRATVSHRWNARAPFRHASAVERHAWPCIPRCLAGDVHRPRRLAGSTHGRAPHRRWPGPCGNTARPDETWLLAPVTGRATRPPGGARSRHPRGGPCGRNPGSARACRRPGYGRPTPCRRPVGAWPRPRRGRCRSRG